MPWKDNYNTQKTVVTIEISPTNIADKKQNKTNLTKAIISNTCALLNSGGGVIVLDFSGETCSKKAIIDFVRTIEQWVKNFVGVATTVSSIKIELQPHQVVLNINGYYHLTTVNYNLCLPTVTEVISLPSNEPVEKIKGILEGKHQMSTGNSSFGFHKTSFIQGQDSGLVESYNIELKQLESSPSKRTTLADRMISKSTKLTSYISAFGNYSGGNIYFGIKDDGTVEGEKITQIDKDEIINKVSKVIKKMVWLGLDEAKKKEQWDIYFVPVKDLEGNLVPATFVIIIAVAKYCHGVFIEEPESYHVVDGKVIRMSLLMWKEKLLTDELLGRDKDGLDGETPTSGQFERSDVIHIEAQNQSGVPRFLDRCNWSSQQMQKKYCSLNGILIRKINDGLWNEFERHAKIEERKHTEGDLKLVILSLRITADYKNGKFDKAERALETYTSLLNTTKDTTVCEVREILARSSLERSKRNHQRSYEIALSGLAKADQAPAGMIVAEYYANFASIITILLSHECESEKRSLLKHKAISAFRTALEHLKVANEHQPDEIDQEQKVHINLAFLYLGCSFSGDAIEERVDEHAISQAVSSLKVVDQHVYDGFELSNYRNTQFLLARSGLHYRRSQNVGVEDSQNTTTRMFLENALKNSKDAKEVAQRCNFDEMLFSSKKFIDICIELLIPFHVAESSHDNR